jgi:benzoylformate decarboxylase
MTYEGRHLFLDACLAEGADVMFGNPGTSEVPIIDALIDRPAMRYVLCLHETAAVTMADAWALVSGRVGLVNLHIGPGLGNAIGSLYNSLERHVPLVVTCGQTDTRMRLREPMTSHDLVAMAKPVTVWAAEVQGIEELPLALARAFRTAREASGPVMLSLPMNVMDAPTMLRPEPASAVFEATRPDPAAIEAAARRLAAARSPALVIGDGVARAGATAAVVRLAEALGAPIFAETLPAHMNVPFRHPLFIGRLPPTAELIAGQLAPHDAIVLIGGEFFEEAFYTTARYFPSQASIIHLERSASRIGRNFSVACGIVADLSASVPALCTALAGRIDAADAAERHAAGQKRKAAERQAHRALVEADTAAGRLSAAVVLDTIARLAPDDAHIAAEAHLSTPHLLRSLRFDDPAQYLSARAGGIGQAFPSAIGAKIAAPGRPVIAVSGEGSALYTPQALWTAAREASAIVFVVLNNCAYDILRSGMSWYRSARGLATDRPTPHFDLSEPAVDFVSLARSFGVDAVRVADPTAFEAELGRALERQRPTLIDAALA